MKSMGIGFFSISLALMLLLTISYVGYFFLNLVTSFTFSGDPNTFVRIEI